MKDRKLKINFTWKITGKPEDLTEFKGLENSKGVLTSEYKPFRYTCEYRCRKVTNLDGSISYVCEFDCDVEILD